MDLKILIKNATPEELADLINTLQNYNTIDSDAVVETPVNPLIGEQEKPRRTRSSKKEAEPAVVAEQVDIFGQTAPEPVVVEPVKPKLPGVVYAEISETLMALKSTDPTKFSKAAGLIKGKYASETLKQIPEARYEEFLADIKAL